ncbi:DUF418 domain-containing protein [Allohahella sp. A8]|uniref:DUF418 domain-containing protein n=1 Tax=Allohahella sp. A8 TaxID=3141461 RepID=UPI000C0BA719|nr:hypothetical protein [Hahellaceae bacterium]|tara:strand:+ start:35956 stop:37188 length:1233 start_codon:yes stop_codon:yes gene_type:complete
MATNQTRERLDVVDAIRALALFGVLVMNLRDMAGLDLLSAEALLALQGPVDRAIEFLVILFFDEKFLSIFSFLFGLSFFLLLERKAHRPGFIFLYARRLLALAGFGLLNIAFLYWGDILLIYAAYGTSMVLLVRLPQRFLLGLAGLFLIGGPLTLALAGVTAGTASQTPADLQALQQFGSPSFLAGVEEGWNRFFSTSGGSNYIEVWDHSNVFGMLVLGLWAGRARIPHQIGRHAKALGRATVCCLSIGFGIEVTRLLLPSTSILATLGLIGPPILAIGYLCAAALWLNRPRAARTVRLLAAPGRLALTNYLAYGLLGQILFYGWAFGWIGTIGSGLLLVVAIIAYVAFLLLSHIWLSSFKMGPLEWIWRCLTYLRVEPLRKSGTAPSDEGVAQMSSASASLPPGNIRAK